MSRTVIFEDSGFKNLLPLVYWRPVFDLRCGRSSLLSKILNQLHLSEPILLVRPELAEVERERRTFSVNSTLAESDEDILLVNGRWLANDSLPELPLNSCLVKNGTMVAARISGKKAAAVSSDHLLSPDFLKSLLADLQPVQAQDSVLLINYPWDLVQQNKSEIFRECTDSGKSGKIYPGVHLLAEESIHIGAGTAIKPGTVLDAEEGPIWIDENVRILPNVVIQGPCYIGPGCLIQSSAHIREGSSLGPVCKVGGEVEDSILHGYSNKQHYGFLGHSYLGEWINCGAGVTNSDLKNTYGQIKVTLNGRDTIDSGLIFVGMVVGDHSKIGIDVCFPSGAVVGTCSSIITSGYAPKFTPSFWWVTDRCQCDYALDEAVKVAGRSMARRKVELSDAQNRLFQAMPEIARKYENRP